MALVGLVSTLGAFLCDSLIGELPDLEGGLSVLFRTPWPPERVLSWAAQVSDMIGSGPGVGGAGGTSLCLGPGASLILIYYSGTQSH